VDDKGREHLVSVGGAFESDDSRVLGDAVYAGLGVGVRARAELTRAVEAGRLERVLPGFHFAGPPVYALFAKGRLRIARVSRFFELLREVIGRSCSGASARRPLDPLARPPLAG
jgi:DNA-binding transcriptional LysR family regulator